MHDTNHSAHRDNDFQRDFERGEGNSRLIEEALLNFAPIRMLPGGYPALVATEQNNDMLLKARNALMHNDIQETARQLIREIEFCQARPNMINSPYEITAQAGLNAIREQRSAADIDRTMQEVWSRTCAQGQNNVYNVNPRYY
jgi:hypothetical protein